MPPKDFTIADVERCVGEWGLKGVRSEDASKGFHHSRCGGMCG